MKYKTAFGTEDGDHPVLRVHHLLCIPLYQGYGYSDGFCENMEAAISDLKLHEKEYLRVVCIPDMVCAGCPNLTGQNTCRNGGGNVEKKDRDLAEALGIRPEGVYTYSRLIQIAREKLTEQVFEESCKNCSWYAQGLCSYEKWRRSI